MIDDNEQDHAPHPRSEKWARGRSMGVNGPVEWTFHVREEVAAAQPVERRRMRGSQDYKTLHLGKGARWAT